MKRFTRAFILFFVFTLSYFGQASQNSSVERCKELLHARSVHNFRSWIFQTEKAEPFRLSKAVWKIETGSGNPFVLRFAHSLSNLSTEVFLSRIFAKLLPGSVYQVQWLHTDEANHILSKLDSSGDHEWDREINVGLKSGQATVTDFLNAESAPYDNALLREVIVNGTAMASRFDGSLYERAWKEAFGSAIDPASLSSVRVNRSSERLLQEAMVRQIVPRPILQDLASAAVLRRCFGSLDFNPGAWIYTNSRVINIDLAYPYRRPEAQSFFGDPIWGIVNWGIDFYLPFATKDFWVSLSHLSSSDLDNEAAAAHHTLSPEVRNEIINRCSQYRRWAGY